MLRNSLCVCFLTLTLIGAADIARSASTSLATFLASAAADAMLPTEPSACNPDRIASVACQRRLEVASIRY